jgi:hypothetical protein
LPSKLFEINAFYVGHESAWQTSLAIDMNRFLTIL